MGKYKVIKDHTKNSMNPVITSVSGWFASLMAGAVFVEYIFDWKGVGVVVVDEIGEISIFLLLWAHYLLFVYFGYYNIVVDILLWCFRSSS